MCAYEPSLRGASSQRKHEVSEMRPDPRFKITVVSSNQRLRTGSFRLRTGESVELTYTDTTPDAPDPFRQQSFTLTPTPDQNKQTIIAMESGGTLTLRCDSSIDCRVTFGNKAR